VVVVVAGVEFVEDQGGAVTADVLDQSKLFWMESMAGGVAWVGGQDDRGTAGEFFGNLVGVDVIAIFCGQWLGNGDEVFRESISL
jgi:hypothetical protein